MYSENKPDGQKKFEVMRSTICALFWRDMRGITTPPLGGDPGVASSAENPPCIYDRKLLDSWH